MHLTRKGSIVTNCTLFVLKKESIYTNLKKVNKNIFSVTRFHSMITGWVKNIKITRIDTDSQVETPIFMPTISQYFKSFFVDNYLIRRECRVLGTTYYPKSDQ